MLDVVIMHLSVGRIVPIAGNLDRWIACHILEEETTAVKQGGHLFRF